MAQYAICGIVNDHHSNSTLQICIKYDKVVLFELVSIVSSFKGFDSTNSECCGTTLIINNIFTTNYSISVMV